MFKKKKIDKLILKKGYHQHLHKSNVLKNAYVLIIEDGEDRKKYATNYFKSIELLTPLFKKISKKNYSILILANWFLVSKLNVGAEDLWEIGHAKLIKTLKDSKKEWGKLGDQHVRVHYIQTLKELKLELILKGYALSPSQRFKKQIEYKKNHYPVSEEILPHEYDVPTKINILPVEINSKIKTEDVASFTGAKILQPLDLKKATIKDLGSIKKIVISKTNIVLEK